MAMETANATFLGIDVVWSAMILAAVATACILFAIHVAIGLRDPMARRVQALNERREQLKAGITASTARRRAKMSSNSRQATDRMRSVLGTLKILQDSQLKDAELKLVRAGIRSKDAAIAIIFARLVLPIVLGGGMALYVYWFHGLADHGPLIELAASAGTLILSYKLPDLIVMNKIARRSREIQKGLPDALDLLVICAEAGLTVDAGFTRVARELGKAYPELGDEFTLTALELGFLTDRRAAFENLAQRVPLDAVRGVVTTMIQTEKYGTPLASTLRVLSAEFRNERMMRAEEKAARLPAIMTVPLVMFILPVLFIVILGPAACSIADNMGH
jgi:tight adherence protein C